MHTPEHDADVSPTLSPNLPTGHGTHTRLLSTYCPTPHTTADIVADGDGDAVLDAVPVTDRVTVPDGELVDEHVTVEVKVGDGDGDDV